MKRWYAALTAGLCVGALAFAACGGGSDDGDKTVTGTQSNKTTAAAAAKSGTPGASGTAGGTTAAGTPGSNATAGANTTPGATGGTPSPNSTPAPGETRAVQTIVGSGNTPIASQASTPTAGERAIIGDGGEVGEDITGGDIDAPPEVLTDLPEPPPGATIDPPTVAAANSGTTSREAIVDLSASEPGIQSTRTIKVGDVIRVGLVLTNVPDSGLAAFSFRLNYDKTKVVAPTIINGSSLSRNPDHNEEGLGTGPAGWSCLLPGPEGDADDPGAFPGDGNPNTGEATASCVGPGPMEYRTGDVVFVTVQFQAIASGSITLAFSDKDAHFFDSTVTALGSCTSTDQIPCRSATLTVQ
jgi:hypothetical protein